MFTQKKPRKEILLLFFYVLLVFYLAINTGIASDDYYAMYKGHNKSPNEIFSSKDSFYFIETPVLYLTHFVWYPYFNLNHQIVENLLKIAYIILSFLLISKFFSIYLSGQSAYWASILFIFYPSHDSTVYFFMLHYLTLSFAFYFYAYYLAYHNRLRLAFFFALLGSFISYGSTPLAMGLFILSALRREVKKGATILIPNLIYILYFIPINIILRIGSPRIIEKISSSSLIKQFILQIASFIDAMLGPSMWLKIYFAISQISALSILIGFISLVLFYREKEQKKTGYEGRILLSFSAIALLSFLMFAFTGRYPQITFNLGNRVTIFSSLLFAYLIIMFPAPRKIRLLIFGIMLLSTLGISDHWKNWKIYQDKLITRIQNNRDLSQLKENEVLFVTGNQYSKYGPLSHIEFFSEDWVTIPVFSLALNKNLQAKTLNKRHFFKNGNIVDTKYSALTPVKNYIYVYDSDKNKLLRFKPEEINNYIATLPLDKRHWLQLLDKNILRGIIIKLMPRLEYAFPKN